MKFFRLYDVRVRWYSAWMILALSGFCGRAGEVTYQFFRFTPTELRNGAAANSVQLAELQLYLEGNSISGATATNPNGNNPFGEEPPLAVDGDLFTKWLDFNRGPLVLDFHAPVTIDGYSWATANDAEERDPVRWLLEGSEDGTNWVGLDDQTEADFPVPLERFAWLPMLGLNQVPDAPVIESFTASDGILISSEGLAVASGTPVTLSWVVSGSTAVSVEPGFPDLIEASGSVSVEPMETTEYTLTAINDIGTSTATLRIIVDGNALPPVLNEFLASAGGDGDPLLDEDGEASDWIEIFNPNPFPINLGGYFLTDDIMLPSKWTFPHPTTMDAGDYLIVFASGKDRSTTGSEFHTNFRLAAEGEYLALIDPDGLAEVDAYAPAYPEQLEDVSYGRTLQTPFRVDYFAAPTPGEANSTFPGRPIVEGVEFSLASRTFSSSLSLMLSSPLPGAEIRYTIDGNLPSDGSALYDGEPLAITDSVQIRARLMQSGMAPGPVTSRSFLRLNSGAGNFTSNLPIIILDNHDAGPVPNGRTLQPGFFALFEPNLDGETTMTATPTVAHRLGMKRRGSSTLNDPKGNYRLEFWEEVDGEAESVELLGLSRHNEWVLFAPYYFDRSLVRIPFIHQLSLDLGPYASRSVFVEVFLNTDGGAVSEADYQGVYVLQERISRDGERVDVERLDPTDVTEPEVTGGYILSIDRPDPEDRGFRTALGHPEDPAIAGPQPWFNYIYPKEQNILPEQVAYIQDYLDDFEAALYGPDFTNPVAGYAPWIDVDSFIDHHILVLLTKNPDALRLSTFMYKPREGPLFMGPIWDFDRTMGCDGDNRASDPTGWDPPYETAQFFQYDWWGRLFQDPDFWQCWIDRWQTARLDALSNEHMLGLVDSLADQVAATQERNFDRWPEVAPNGGPLSPLSGWEGEVDHLKNWLAQRAAWIDAQLPAPPAFNRESGTIPAGAEIRITSPGNTVYYTLDGSDPRSSGGVAAAGAKVTSGTTIPSVLVASGASATAHVPTAEDAEWETGWTEIAFDDSGWLTGTTGVGYDENPDYTQLIGLDVGSVMNEINTSVYIRIPFPVENPDRLETLELRMKYDDGFVAYLNGVRVAGANPPVGTPAWNSASNGQHDDSQAVVFEVFDLTAHLGLLQEGTNVLAIHGLNDNLGSSDLIQLPELHATHTITSSPLQVQESTVVSARAFNGTDWSALAQKTYVVGTGAESGNLLISELHYRPEGPSDAELAAGFAERKDFEFLELLNVGNGEVDLSGVYFGDGIEFVFGPTPPLPPGGRLVLVNHQAAFEMRYADRLEEVTIDGEFTGNLSNDGETIQLLAADGTEILSFTYNDQPPWPTSSDGEGFSLVLIDPFGDPTPDPQDPFNWRASTALHGNPGGTDAVDFSGDPLADADGNGRVDFLDFAFGHPDANPSAAVRLLEPDGQLQEYFVYQFSRNLAADEAVFTVEFSPDLVNWTHDPQPFTYLGSENQGDGTAIVTYRSAGPVNAYPAGYVRLRVSR